MGEKGQTVSRGWGNGNIIYEVDSDRYQDKQSSNIQPNEKMDKQMFSETKTFYFYLNCILKVIECFLITFQFFVWTLTVTSRQYLAMGIWMKNFFLKPTGCITRWLIQAHVSL